MIKGHAYQLTLAYSEIAALEEYLDNNHVGLESATLNASFSASAHGVTITFGTENDRDRVWGFVIDSVPDTDEEDE